MVQPTSMHPYLHQCLTPPTPSPMPEAIRSLTSNPSMQLCLWWLFSSKRLCYWGTGPYFGLSWHGQPAVCRSLKFAA